MSVPITENAFIQGYLDLTSRQMPNHTLIEHKKIMKEVMTSKSLSKGEILKIMSTLLATEANSNNLEYKEKSLELVLNSCNEFTKKHCLGAKKIVVITDKEAVEEISDIILNILNLKPFKSGNIELSLIISSFLLNKVNKPYLTVNLSDKNAFDKASVNKIAMRLFVANKYKEHVIGDNKKIYNVIEVYDNASKYKNENSSEICIVEWHELNQEIDKWKQMIPENLQNS